MGGSSPAYPAEVQGGLPGHLAHPHQVGDLHPQQEDQLRKIYVQTHLVATKWIFIQEMQKSNHLLSSLRHINNIPQHRSFLFWT